MAAASRAMARLAVLWMALLALLAAAPALAQRQGTLIEARPVTAPAGMRAWRIRYWTSSDGDRPIEVTGMVVAPAGDVPSRPRRVIAWTHGTWGVAERCAPSLGDNFFTATPGLGEAIGRGYAVVAPDYPGLGSAMPHPYLAGVSTGRSVLDAVRAAGSIPEAAAGRRFAVWGESQGGHAALWTGQIARAYAPDLDLVGVAAIVPPTDLARNMAEGSDRAVRAMLMSFTATSWSRHYGAPMSAFGRRTTQNVMTRLADNNCINLDRRPRLGTILGIATVQRDLRNLNLAAIQPWGRLMRENSPSARAVSAPLLIVQGTADTIVAPAVTRAFAHAACANGASVRYISVPGGEHATVTAAHAGETLDWIGARFDDARAPRDCGAF